MAKTVSVKKTTVKKNNKKNTSNKVGKLKKPNMYPECK